MLASGDKEVDNILTLVAPRSGESVEYFCGEKDNCFEAGREAWLESLSDLLMKGKGDGSSSRDAMVSG